MTRRHWRVLLAAVTAWLFVACSAPPAGQNDPGTTTSAPAASPDYGALTAAIEQAITSGWPPPPESYDASSRWQV